MSQSNSISNVKLPPAAPSLLNVATSSSTSISSESNFSPTLSGTSTPSPTKSKGHVGPLLGKLAAKKRLAAFSGKTSFSLGKVNQPIKSSAHLDFEKGKQVESKDNATVTTEKKFKKKKKEEKVSIIEQIRNEENRIKQALGGSMDKFNPYTEHLINYIDNPESLKRLEEKGKKYVAMIEKRRLDELKKEENEKKRMDRNREKDDKRKKEKERTRIKEKNKLKDQEIKAEAKRKDAAIRERTEFRLPNDWVEFKKLGLSMDEFSKKLKENSKNSVILKLKMMTDVIADGQNDNRKTYPGRLIRFTKQKPSLSFAPNSDKITDLYLNRQSVKMITSHEIYHLMKEIWNNPNAYIPDVDCEKEIDYRGWYDRIWAVNESSTDVKISSKWDSDNESDEDASDDVMIPSRKDVSEPLQETAKVIVPSFDELPKDIPVKEDSKVDTEDKSSKVVDGSALELNQEYEAFLQMVGGESTEEDTMKKAQLLLREFDENKKETVVDSSFCEEKPDVVEESVVKAKKLSKKEKKKAKKLKKEKIKAAAKLARKERREARKLAKKAKKKERKEKEKLEIVEESKNNSSESPSSKNLIENSSTLSSNKENTGSEEAMDIYSDGYTMSDSSSPQLSSSTKELSDTKVSEQSFELYSPSGSPAASPPSPYSPSYSPQNGTLDDTPDMADLDASVEDAQQSLNAKPNEIFDSQLFPSNIPLPGTVKEQPKLIPSPKSIPLPPTSVRKSIFHNEQPPPQSKVEEPESHIDSKIKKSENLPFSLMEIPLPPVASDPKESFSPSVESVVSSQTSTPEPSEEHIEETPEQPKEQSRSIIFKLASTKKPKRLLKPVLSNFDPEEDAKKKNFDVSKEIGLSLPKTDDKPNMLEPFNSRHKALKESNHQGIDEVSNYITDYQETVDSNGGSDAQNVDQVKSKSSDTNEYDAVNCESLYDDLLDDESKSEMQNKNDTLDDFDDEKTTLPDRKSDISFSIKERDEKSQDKSRETSSAERKKRDRSYDSKRETRSPERTRETKSPDRKRIAKSPDRKKDARSPERKRDARSQDRKKNTRSPERKRDVRSPDRKNDTRSPDRKKDGRSPERKRDARSPEKRRDARSPERRRGTRSPDRKRIARSPDRKRDTRSPDRKRNARSPDYRRRSDRSPRRKRSPNQRSRSPSYRRDRRRSRSPNYRHEQYGRCRERSPSDKKQRLDYYQSKDHERLPAEFNPDIARELLQGQGTPTENKSSELPKNIPSITSYSSNTAVFTEEHQPEWNYNASDFYDHSDISNHSQNWNQLNYQSSNNVYLKPIAPEPESNTQGGGAKKLPQEIAPKDSKVLGTESKKGNNSPKRLSLDDRLAREHGLQLLEAADPLPVAMPAPNPTWKIPDFSALKSIPLPPSCPSPVPHPAVGQSSVVQVGNMLQILPQECPVTSISDNSLTPNAKDSKTTTAPVPKTAEAPKTVVDSQSGVSDETTSATAAVVASASAAAATDPSLIPLLAVAAAEAVALGTDSQTTLNTLLKIIESKKKGELVEKEAPPPLPVTAPPLPPPETSPDLQDEVNLLKEKQEKARKARKERKEMRRKEREERRTARKKEEEKKMREREEAKKEEERLKETVEERSESLAAPQPMDHDTLLKEAMTEEPDLGSPVAEYELENEAAEAEAQRVREAEEAIEKERRKYYPKPTPDKGILIMNFNYSTEGAKRKRVSFGDGVLPGEGTSPSGGEETPHSPPPDNGGGGGGGAKPKKLRKKNKPRLRTIKLFEGIPSDTSDAMCLSPPPPPSSPPPPPPPEGDSPLVPSPLLFLYPGYTQYKLKEPGVCVLYTHPTPHTLVCGAVNGGERRLSFGALESSYVSPAVL